ncbi:MAG: 3'-5' exonuclease [Patescibacteria group bacterium]|nr:3'-5' exonuclease [Patescibacteria group bacterium]
MDFKKDLLLVDLEMTGLDASRHEIIQMAALLLDKKTLEEKEAFNSYIKPRHWKRRDPQSMKVNRITWEQLKNAPSLQKAIGDFDLLFGHDVVLSYYGGPVDMDFLRAAYKKIHKKFKFDYHYFNLWGLFYGYLAARNKLKNKKKFTGFALDDFMEDFKIKSSSRHDALEDCRIEAEILRKVIANI